MHTTQCQKILKHMREHGSITTYEAYTEYGITRLPARISDLKEQGVNIARTMRTKKSKSGSVSTFAEYRVVG